MKSRVPSVEDWLELVAGRLLDGEKLLLKSLPGLGKTYVCQRLAHIFGPSVVHVRGRRIIAADFGTSANEIANELRSTVEKEGCAQLLFDDYGAALTSPVGQRLQATLHGLLVDSADADRIGALVTARWGENLHVAKAGSPLLSRLDFVHEAQWETSDIPVGQSVESLERDIGRSAGMLAIALGPDGLYDPHRVTRHLDLNLRTRDEIT